MGLFGRRDTIKLPSLESFATMVHTGADLQSALDMTLSALDGEQQREAVLTLVGALPPSVRATLLGNAIMQIGDNTWGGVKQSLADKERREMVNRALIEEGLQHRAVDLGNLVIGTEVSIDLGTSKKKPFPKNYYTGGVQPKGSLQLESRGGNEFVVAGPVNFIDNSGTPSNFSDHSVVRVQSGHARKEPATNVRYGDPLLITREGMEEWQTVYSLKQPHPLFRREGLPGPENVVRVTNIGLDGTSAFHNLR